MNYDAGSCDIAVIGAGHAGIEAALASARLGLDTICFTLNLDSIGNMPCNPAIGGTGKGQLVRELDALGGEMAAAADKACIQYRMLNLGKGPAVHSLRAQADRRRYQIIMKHRLEMQEHLRLKQAEIVEIGVESQAAGITGAADKGSADDAVNKSDAANTMRVAYVKTRTGAVYRCRGVVVCSGTHLGGRTITGEVVRESGPDGLLAASMLTENLQKLGLEIRRFKTGTPPRVNARTVDFSRMEPQPGDEHIVPFSFETTEPPENSALCYLTYTNERTHEILRANLSRSPLYSGVIEGVGARYCPSIEDKVVRFADKKRHQLFIEPMGLETEELYIQGFSSSMPEEVQIEAMHTIPGLENAEMTRSAYAIEYDCVDPTELRATLECKKIAGLYGAGQFNGSSGYEEAAVQGFVAGVNAALKLLGREPMILNRTDGYIGTLVDDLVTKGTNEPYRMMTSRSEYRLLHRQDNADKRLVHIGYRIGLVSRERYERVCAKYAAVDAELARLERAHLPPSPELAALLESLGTTPPLTGCSLADLMRRPQVSYDALAMFDPARREIAPEIKEQVGIALKYEGYIRRQLKLVEEFSKMESRELPENLDYDNLAGLRIEARQKLARIKPRNFGQAQRISGVSPADIAALMIHLEK